jgi:hypothetical protein
MNRRAFLSTTLGGIAAAVVAPLVPTPSTPVAGFTPLTYTGVYKGITFKGAPFVWDANCATSRVHMLPRDYFAVQFVPPSASLKGSD